MSRHTPQSLEPANPPPALMRALRQLLRPLVRLLLSEQVSFPTLTRLLKSIYVEVAETDFAIEGKEQTTSRISLLTGIHRKDVKALRAGERDAESVPQSVSLGAQLVARWTGMDAYLDANGQPRSLARLESDGEEVSFEGLVAGVSKDIRSRAVLDEWLRLGIVEIDPSGRVRLRRDAFVPDQGYDEKAYYFGRNLRDHLSAAARNLSGEHPPLFERSVYYGDLPAEAAEELAKLSSEEAMQALQSVNRRALALKEQGEGTPGPRERIALGVYFYREAIVPEADEDDV